MNKEQWIERFKDKDSEFSFSDWRSSVSWSCCAIGSRLQLEHNNIYKEIEKQNTGMRRLLTDQAYKLGHDFYKAVERNKVEEAEMIFNEIQDMPTILREETIK